MEKYINKLRGAVESKYFKIVFYSVAMLIFAGIIFAAGVGVGIHKARYSYQWGENYQQNFAGSSRDEQGLRGMMRDEKKVPGMMPDFGGRDFRNAHGIAGQIVSIGDNNVIIKDRNNMENTITVMDKTLIKNGRSDVRINDLKAGDNVVVMGNPGDNGTINADLIRVFNNTNTNTQNN